MGRCRACISNPTKSKIIFINRAITIECYAIVEVVPPGGTIRYLGYEIGTGYLENKNWAIRIQKIQRRLLTATRVATSVEYRVLILNSIVLPSLLFTASVYYIPDWAEKELRISTSNFCGHMQLRQTLGVTRSTRGYW